MKGTAVYKTDNGVYYLDGDLLAEIEAEAYKRAIADINAESHRRSQHRRAKREAKRKEEIKLFLVLFTMSFMPTAAMWIYWIFT